MPPFRVPKQTNLKSRTNCQSYSYLLKYSKQSQELLQIHQPALFLSPQIFLNNTFPPNPINYQLKLEKQKATKS